MLGPWTLQSFIVSVVYNMPYNNRNNQQNLSDQEAQTELNKKMQKQRDNQEWREVKDTCSRMQPLRKATRQSNALRWLSLSFEFCTRSKILFFISLIALPTHSGLSLCDIMASKSWIGVESPIFLTIVITDVFSTELMAPASLLSPIFASSFTPDCLSLVDFFSYKTNPSIITKRRLT